MGEAQQRKRLHLQQKLHNRMACFPCLYSFTQRLLSAMDEQARKEPGTVDDAEAESDALDDRHSYARAAAVLR
jgi:hypothetical protein